MTGLTSPAGTFSYTHNPGLAGTTSASSLIAKLALPNGAFITNTYDNNARMLGTWLTNSVSNLDSSVYTYNVGNQRTTVTRTGENTADYTYDPIGQVIADQASEVSGGAMRVNEQLHYAFDATGNLNYRTNNTMIENFQVNSLNELTANTNGGRLTVVGTTTSTATNVTVNGTNALRYGDATFAATNMPLTTTYAASASDSYGRHSTNTVTVSIATNNAAYQYDGNGNLTNDGLRSFAYDNENQLIQVWVAGKWFSQFAYDGKMRRRIRQEFTWQSSRWVQTNEVYYVYDGNVVIQERNANNLPTTTYTRGLDFSARLQGAGGIGGLLSMTLNTAPGGSSSNSMFYHSDGNGNVTMLINSSQYIVAKYLYDAFGNVLSAAGSLAQQNLYRFSSKEAHLNSGLVYYLYRFYDPNLQRWPNRDPLDEPGFESLQLQEKPLEVRKFRVGVNFYNEEQLFPAVATLLEVANDGGGNYSPNWPPELLESPNLFVFLGNSVTVYWDYDGLFSLSACIKNGLVGGLVGGLTGGVVGGVVGTTVGGIIGTAAGPAGTASGAAGGLVGGGVGGVIGGAISGAINGCAQGGDCFDPGKAAWNGAKAGAAAGLGAGLSGGWGGGQWGAAGGSRGGAWWPN
jgi:RHS repeat-associated protein